MSSRQLAPRPSIGDVVEVDYEDHHFFKNSYASEQKPQLVKMIGRVDYQDDHFLRLIWEEYPDPEDPARTKSAGVCILKRDIVELKGFLPG